jgi:hypothetical protein
MILVMMVAMGVHGGHGFFFKVVDGTGERRQHQQRDKCRETRP